MNFHIMSVLKLTNGKTHPLYYRYMGYQFLSNVFVSAQVAISTHNMLQVISSCEGAMRTVNYIGKDVFGQLGSLLYMSKLGFQADQNPGKFLFKSHVIQQSSFLLVFATPLLPEGMFLPMAGLASVMSNISFTGYGALNAKAIQELSSKNMQGVDDMNSMNNTGEIYSKITTVNTLGSTIGLALGIGISFLVPSYTLRLCLVPLLAYARVYTFNQSIRGLVKV